jgi:Flp pilus assembly protein TadG
MISATHSIHKFHRRQGGQVLVLVALFLGVMLGMTAIAIDLGTFLADRRDLQNAADAIALAASQELPNQDAATAKAQQWATKNGIPVADMTLTFTAQSLPNEPNPKVRVQLEDDHGFIFARAVGVESAGITVAAAAIKTSPAGGDGVIPLSVTEPVLENVQWGDPVVLKYDSNNIMQGNTGPICIDGPGAGNCTSSDRYCTGIEFGSQNVVCAEGADPTYCDGPYLVDTEPGNIIGATRTAIDYRMDNTEAECDDFAEVFQDDPTSSDPTVYAFNSDCNPFNSAAAYTSMRVVIVPVIEQLCNGSCEVTIVDFALFFLEGYAPSCPDGGAPAGGMVDGEGGAAGHNPGHNPPGQNTPTPTNTPDPAATPTPEPCNGNGGSGCSGNECEVIGRFVRVHQNVGMLAGTFNSESSNQFVRLTE